MSTGPSQKWFTCFMKRHPELSFLKAGPKKSKDVGELSSRAIRLCLERLKQGPITRTELLDILSETYNAEDGFRPYSTGQISMRVNQDEVHISKLQVSPLTRVR